MLKQKQNSQRATPTFLSSSKEEIDNYTSIHPYVHTTCTPTKGSQTNLGDLSGLGDLLARLVAHVRLALPDQLQRQLVQPVFCVVVGQWGVLEEGTRNVRMTTTESINRPPRAGKKRGAATTLN